MNKGVLSGAVLVAAFTVAAAPIAAWSTSALAQTGEPHSTQAPPPDQQNTGGRPGIMGGMGMQGGMEQMMRGGQAMGPMSRMMMRGTPRHRCGERLARRAAIVAYTITKLNLTAEQKPLWDKLNGVLQTATDREQQLCSSLPNADQPGQETILDRANWREQFLSARLEALHQAKPALEALYQSLSPDQKAIIDHPFRR